MKEKGWTRVLNKMLIFSIFMLTVFTLMVRDAQAAVKVDVERIEIVGNDVLAAGRSTTYKANVTPSNATNKGVLWSVVPENSGATITTAGTLKIDAKCTLNSIEVIATSKDNKEILEKKKVAINSTAIETINVLDDKGDSVLGKTITLYRTKITDNTKIDTIVTPSIKWVNKNAIIDYKAYKFISSDENLVTVDQEGHIQVTGNTTGKATIKCQAIDGTKDGNGKLLTKSFMVKVIEPVEHIEITGNELVGGLNSVKYTASAFPTSATNKKLVWSVYPENKGVNISKTGVLSVTKDCQIDSVNVIAKADEDSAVYTTKKVAINKAGIKAINFDDNNGNRVGKTINLYRVKVTEETPVDYKLNANITWKMDGVTGKNCPYVFSSSDERIATVDQSGYVVVTGEMTGKCTIKCVAIDGSKNQNGVAIQKSVEINVTNPLSKLELAIPDGRSKYVAKGSTIKLAVKKIADYGTTPAKTIKFTSSNVSVATVDGNGVVTFKADSYSPVTITATVNDDTKVSGSIELIASNAISNIQIGDIPVHMMGSKNSTTLTVSDCPIAYKLGFNAPNPNSAMAKTVCPDLVVSSNMPEYLGATYSNGILYLWPRKELTKQNITIKISSMDGSSFSKSWLFKIKAPEEPIESKMKGENVDTIKQFTEFDASDTDENDEDIVEKKEEIIIDSTDESDENNKENFNDIEWSEEIKVEEKTSDVD